MGSLGWGSMERDVVAAVPAMTYLASSRTDAWSFTAVQGGLLERLGTGGNELCSDPSRWVLLVHRADRERVVAERRRAARTGRLELEYRLQTPDGEVYWVHDVAVRDDRYDDGMCGIVTDLTEHLQADDVLEQLHDARLSAVNRVLRATSVRDMTVQLFVHDMLSPLTAVAGLARTLRDRGEQVDAKDRERVFDRMVAASDRVVALVDDFARFWGMPLTEGDIPVREVPLASFVADVVEEVGAADGQVDVDVGDVFVETNPELLRRVLVGLVHNAVKHTPEGTAVLVSAAELEGCVVVEVEDEGPGIPAHLREQVFEPHEHARTGTGVGMGIGLTLVRAAVELLGGDVYAQESATGGTIVRVELPRSCGTVVVNAVA